MTFFQNHSCACVCGYSVAQLYPTLCDPMNCSPSGSSVCGILQPRILEWVAICFSRGSSWPRDWTQVSCVSCFGRWILNHWRHLGSPAMHTPAILPCFSNLSLSFYPCTISLLFLFSFLCPFIYLPFLQLGSSVPVSHPLGVYQQPPFSHFFAHKFIVLLCGLPLQP